MATDSATQLIEQRTAVLKEAAEEQKSFRSYGQLAAHAWQVEQDAETAKTYFNKAFEIMPQLDSLAKSPRPGDGRDEDSPVLAEALLVMAQYAEFAADLGETSLVRRCGLVFSCFCHAFYLVFPVASMLALLLLLGPPLFHLLFLLLLPGASHV